MEKDFGEITSVSGNSLGGALANYVGVEYNHVRSVTLNPAMLPASALDVEKQYDNITNYISEYDLLNLSQDAIGMGNQVPGLKYTIYNGVPSIAGIGFNHTGYRREDSMHTPYVTIGRKGEPGYGKIYVDAHHHIVSSIWTGQPLYGGRSERIDLNVETLQMLSESIETSVLERLGLAQTYIGHTVEIINHESEAYESRLNTVREAFQEAFEDIIDDGLLRGIRFANSVFKLMIQKLHALLDTIERTSQVLNGLLNSPPAALIEFIINKPIDAESLVSEIRGSLEELEETLDEFALAVEDTVYNTIEDIFKAGQEKFHDVVVGELEAHFEHVESNYQRMNAQVEEFGTQVGQVANAFKTIDQRVAHAITDQLAIGDIDPMTSTTDFTMEDSPYLLEFMKFKEQYLDLTLDAFKGTSSAILFPIAMTLINKVTLIEIAGKALVGLVKGGNYLSLYGNPITLVLSLFTDYDDRVKEQVNAFLHPVEEMNETVEGIRTGLQKFMENYPTVIDNLRPYIDSALFNNTGYYNIHIYNTAATSILKDMQLLFDDIVFQLSDHEAEAITSLYDVSSNVKQNMSIIEEQTARAATW
ncbi:SA1320 family protein [Amphibacillus cookii]|uniref:SA1320 family protein n=1 Tax=Amphibacillus cookii TaxID=767787 RepID=UPI001959B512|nr:hypothetical protein [Amphibacillus cookii]MBM7542920.1 chaperonin cofactor prefoldin [Amphibacillus cookii]